MSALRSAFETYISVKLFHSVFTSSMCTERIQKLWSASQIHLLKQCAYGYFLLTDYRVMKNLVL